MPPNCSGHRRQPVLCRRGDADRAGPGARSARDAVLARAARLGPQTWRAQRRLADRRDGRTAAARAAAAPRQSIDELAEAGLLVAEGTALRSGTRSPGARSRRPSRAPPPGHPRPHPGRAARHRLRDHARLAFHAEAAGDRSAALHHATVAGRRAAELGSHREAAVQFQRALRFAAGEPLQALAARYDELADELSVIEAAAPRTPTAGLGLWREAGDQLHEGDTLSRVSGALWRLCRAARRPQPGGRAGDPGAARPEHGAGTRIYPSCRCPAQRDAIREAVTLTRRAHEIATTLGLLPGSEYALTLEARRPGLPGGNGRSCYAKPWPSRSTTAPLRGSTRLYQPARAELCQPAIRRVRAVLPRWRRLLCRTRSGRLPQLPAGRGTATLDRLGRWDEAVALAGAACSGCLPPRSTG